MILLKKIEETFVETSKQPAIENTPKETFSQRSMHNTQNGSHPGVLYDPSLEHKLATKKTADKNLKVEEDLMAIYFENEYLLEN